MKKILMGATALSLLGFAGSASAQEWSMRVGGFFTSGIGYVDADGMPNAAGDHDAQVEIVANSEITFNARLTADNGLTFGIKGELENNGAGGNMDEYVAFVSGSFGRIEIGAEDGAADRLHGAPAGATAFTAIADGTGLLCDYATAQSGCAIDTDADETNDAIKITYFTPTFAGFQAGVSYTPGSGEGGTSTNGSDDDDDAIEVGAAYNNDFGGFSLGIGAGAAFGLTDIDGTIDQTYGGSLNVGFGGFTVGAAYQNSEFVDAEDDSAWGAGVNYSTGPWLFGVQYGQGLDGVSEDQWGLSGGADYALAPGVTTGATVEYLDDDGDSAWAGGVWMNFDF